jgi:hypothetical protein
MEKRFRTKLLMLPNGFNNKGECLMEYVVLKFQNGWYNFEKIDQSNSMIRIANLCCRTDKNAIKQAKNIVGNKNSKIIIKEG